MKGSSAGIQRAQEMVSSVDSVPEPWNPRALRRVYPM